MNIGSILGLVSGGLLKKLLPLLIAGAVMAVAAVGYIVLKNAREAGAAQVEAVRLADAAAATAEALDRTTASAEALQAAHAVSNARVREAEGEAGELKLRLSTALQGAERGRVWTRTLPARQRIAPWAPWRSRRGLSRGLAGRAQRVVSFPCQWGRHDEGRDCRRLRAGPGRLLVRVASTVREKDCGGMPALPTDRSMPWPAGA